MGTDTDDDTYAEDMATMSSQLLGTAKQQLGALDERGDEALGQVVASLNAMDAATVDFNTADALLEDDMIPEGGRRRKAGESYDRGASRLRDATERSLSALTVLEQQLKAAAAPKAPSNPAEVQGLRDEVRMLMGDARGPEAFAVAERIVAGDEDLAAVLLSRWGRTLLASRDLDDMDEVLGILSVKAAEQGSPEQRKAAAKLAAVTELRKAHAARVNGAHHRMSAAGRRIGRSS